MLKIKVSKKIKKKQIINNFEYNFDSTGTYKLEGENGSGKSTLLSLIYKTDSEYDGIIQYNGKNISDIEDVFWKNNIISYVSQDKKLLDNRSLLENVDILIQDYHITLTANTFRS